MLENFEVELRRLRAEAVRQNKAGRTWNEMACEMGMLVHRRGPHYPSEAGDVSRLRRMLGLAGYVSVKRGVTYRYGPQKNAKYENLVKLAKMLRVDPVDFGL